jgi:ubiquinone/menaquinone biosynthesis C-methylase UbiE
MSSTRMTMRPPSAPAERPPGWLRPLFDQFARPSGWLGRLAGALMAKTEDDDRWIVDLMDVQPADRVLEVGFGPGVAIRLIAERATQGFVAGVDPSDVMLRQATQRNQAAVASSKVELRCGSVESLPYSDAAFDKVVALHSLYFWPSLEQGLREITRVLVPGGLLVLGVRMKRSGVGRLNPSRYGLTDQAVAEIIATLSALGYTDVQTHQREFTRDTVTAILARRG